MACGSQAIHYSGWERCDEEFAGGPGGSIYAEMEPFFEAIHKMHGTYDSTTSEYFAIASAIDKARRAIKLKNPQPPIASVAIYSDAQSAVNVLNGDFAHVQRTSIDLAQGIGLLAQRLKDACNLGEVRFSWHAREEPVMRWAHRLSQIAHEKGPQVTDGDVYKLIKTAEIP